MDGSMLSAVRNELASIIGHENFIISFEGEKLFMYDEVQRCFTQSRLGKSHIYIQRVRDLGVIGTDVSQEDFLRQWFPVRQWFHILFTHPDRDATLAMAQEFYAAMEEYAKSSPAQLRKDNIDITKKMEQTVKGNVLFSLLLPALDRVMHIGHRNKADSEATLAVIATLVYQKQTGKLPESLEDVVNAGLLASLPVDPYSDGPLVYKVTDGGFTLYSVGPNCKDDGGVYGTHGQGSQSLWQEDRGTLDAPESGGDAVFWPVKR
jgi:hypothetical protein